MKKGDIVRVREQFKDLDWAAANMAAYTYVEELKDRKVILPEELIVSNVRPKWYCQGIDDGIEFEEIPGEYRHRAFEVVLEAGKPPLDQLMNETQIEKPLITSPWGVII